MIIRAFVVFYFVLSYITAHAQYSNDISSLLKDVKEASFYDSLNLFNLGQEAIKQASTSEKHKGAVSEVYLYYGSYFYYTRNISRAKLYFNQSIKEAEKTNNQRVKMLSTIRLLFLEHSEGLMPDVETEFKTLLIEAKKGKDYESASEIINFLGILKEEKNQPQAAAKLYLEGLAFAEAHNVTHYPAVYRNNLGLIKLYTDQTDDALIDFEKGLELAKKENDGNLISHIQINICLVYVEKNRVDDALKLFSEVINYARINNHPRELSASFINLVSAFNNSGKTELALSYADSAIIVLKNSSLNLELNKAYLGKTEVLISLNRNTDARKTLDTAIKLSEKTGSLEDKASYYFLLHKINKSEKNYKEALEDFLSYRKIKDSIEKNINGKIIQELQLKYNVQKNEIELEKEKSKYLLLEQKNQDERFFKWLSIGIALIVLIIISGTIYYFYSLKLRDNHAAFSRQLIENIEQDRLRISMDLHDDIGQSLSMIKSKIILLKNDAEHKVLETELARVIEQTREISKNLYPSYLEKIGLVRSIARLMENIQSSSDIECSFDVTELVEEFSIQTKTHIYRILQECTNNTIRHAKASALKTSITEKNGGFVLIYQDNGIGLSSKQKNGLGLLSIRERAKIINGIVIFEEKTNKSFKLTLKLNS